MKAARLFLVLASLLVAGFAGAAAAQTYPSRPLKVLIGFPAGGPPDSVLRQVASRLEQGLGTTIVVENKPGGSGTIAAAAVARAEPDGYTLLFGVAANLAVAPAVMKAPPYDPVKAFTPIVEVARGPYVWLVRSDAPATTMQEFVAWARSRPGKLNYASPGPGSVHHLAVELLKQAAGIDMVHVPYRTTLYAPLLAGEVDAIFESMPGPMPHLASGKLRALGVTGTQRLAALPEVPTMAEQGLPDMDLNSWWGFVGPAGMPASVVQRLNQEIARVLAEPELRATLARWSVQPHPGSAEDFGRYIAEEGARWKRVVQRSGMALE